MIAKMNNAIYNPARIAMILRISVYHCFELWVLVAEAHQVHFYIFVVLPDHLLKFINCVRASLSISSISPDGCDELPITWSPGKWHLLMCEKNLSCFLSDSLGNKPRGFDIHWFSLPSDVFNVVPGSLVQLVRHLQIWWLVGAFFFIGLVIVWGIRKNR